MSASVLADLNRHINLVPPQHQNHTEPSGDEIVHRATFDRAEQLALVPTDYCLTGIGALCHVKASTCLRVEYSQFGSAHPVRLLALTGSEANTEFAHALYLMIDDMIEETIIHYKHTHPHSTRPQWTEVGKALAAKINIWLKRLAGYCAEHHQQARLVG